MGRQGKIGQGHFVAREPGAVGEQPVEIEHVLVQVRLGHAQHGRIGRRPALVALDDLFLQHIAGDLVIELGDHPFDHPPHLGAAHGLGRNKPGDDGGRVQILDGVDIGQ